MPSLYGIWLEAHNKGILAQEWRLAHIFIEWATANKYKAEYGYKGDFTPENLIKKIPEADKPKEQYNEAMCHMKVAELKELAEEKEIDIKGLTRKDEIIKAIKEGTDEGE